jgi:hypothetical protein
VTGLRHFEAGKCPGKKERRSDLGICQYCSKLIVKCNIPRHIREAHLKISRRTERVEVSD